MAPYVNDYDIEVFLRQNAGRYPSQVSLIQAAVRSLWPRGAPTGAAERVVRVCLGRSRHVAAAGRITSPLLPR